MVRPWSGGNPSVSVWALAYVRDVLTGQEVPHVVTVGRANSATPSVLQKRFPPSRFTV